MTRDRQQAEKTGRRAEWLAAWFLRLKGYRILAARAKMPAGELDLVAQKGRQLAFVEVKYRPDLDMAADSIRPTQQQRIARAAAQFLARHPALQQLDVRYDAVLMAHKKMPRHILDAWR